MLVISFSHSNENNTSEFETFLRGILPPSNTDLRILQGSLMEQLVKLLQLLDREEKEVLVISADAVPTAGTLQLMLSPRFSALKSSVARTFLRHRIAARLGISFWNLSWVAVASLGSSFGRQGMVAVEGRGLLFGRLDMTAVEVSF